MIWYYFLPCFYFCDGIQPQWCGGRFGGHKELTTELDWVVRHGKTQAGVDAITAVGKAQLFAQAAALMVACGNFSSSAVLSRADLYFQNDVLCVFRRRRGLPTVQRWYPAISYRMLRVHLCGVPMLDGAPRVVSLNEERGMLCSYGHAQ
jgi:hypothetical protein